MRSPELDAALELCRQGRAQEALTALEGLAARPDIAARVRALQALIYRGLNRYGEALTAALQAIDKDPSLAEAWECAGFLLVSRKKWPEARQLLSIALEALPDHALLQAYYALALAKTGELALANDYANRALRTQPDLAAARLARIEILTDVGYYDLALKESAKLAVVAPDTAAFALGSASFMTGDYARGLTLMTSVMHSGWRGREIPEWDGGKTSAHVVLYSGQGYGDTLHFARYLPLASARAGKVTLQVPKSLVRLLRANFPGITVIDEDADALPDDVTLRCALPRLATLADNGFDPLTEKVPYLRADGALASAWRERLKDVKRPRIGLAWASPWQMNNPFRVIPFAALKVLIEAAGGHLVSLQLGAEGKSAAEAGLYDPAPFITDFADSAALVNELDLVISIDSAPAHLAGALGKPAWLMLPFSAEWRWLIAREDSLWYPSMRLFRQSNMQDWPGVIQKISGDVGKFLSGDRSVLNPARWQGPALKRHPQAVPLTGIEKDYS